VKEAVDSIFEILEGTEHTALLVSFAKLRPFFGVGSRCTILPILSFAWAPAGDLEVEERALVDTLRPMTSEQAEIGVAHARPSDRIAIRGSRQQFQGQNHRAPFRTHASGLP